MRQKCGWERESFQLFQLGFARVKHLGVCRGRRSQQIPDFRFPVTHISAATPDLNLDGDPALQETQLHLFHHSGLIKSLASNNNSDFFLSPCLVTGVVWLCLVVFDQSLPFSRIAGL